MAGTPIIEAEDVTKRFGDHQVLTRVRLPVMERDVVCVVGPPARARRPCCAVSRSSRCRARAASSWKARRSPRLGRPADQGRRTRRAFRHRHGVPALQSVAAHVGPGEPDRGASTGEEDAARRGGRRGRNCWQGRPFRQARRLSGAAVGRPATAGGDRPRTRHVAQGAAVRRGDVGARPRAPPRGPAGHAPARLES